MISGAGALDEMRGSVSSSTATLEKDLTDLSVQRDADGEFDALVEGLAYEAAAEDQRLSGRRDNELCPSHLLQRRQELAWGETDHRGDVVHGEGPPEHGGHIEELAGLR